MMNENFDLYIMYMLIQQLTDYPLMLNISVDTLLHINDSINNIITIYSFISAPLLINAPT